MPFTSPSLGPYVELKIKKLESVIGVFVVISVAANRSLNRPQHVFFFFILAKFTFSFLATPSAVLLRKFFWFRDAK